MNHLDSRFSIGSCAAAKLFRSRGSSLVATQSRLESTGARQQGFSLIELLMVVAIILTIAAIAIPRMMQAVQNARVARAIGDIHTLESDVLSYQISNGSLPATNSLISVGRGDLLDPWGSPYVFVNYADPTSKGLIRKDKFLKPMNGEYDLYSIGPDHLTKPSITHKNSYDDVIRADDGAFVDLAANY